MTCEKCWADAYLRSMAWLPAGFNEVEQSRMTIRQLFDLFGAFFEVLWSIALEIADKFRGREEA